MGDDKSALLATGKIERRRQQPYSVNDDGAGDGGMACRSRQKMADDGDGEKKKLQTRKVDGDA